MLQSEVNSVIYDFNYRKPHKIRFVVKTAPRESTEFDTESQRKAITTQCELSMVL